MSKYLYNKLEHNYKIDTHTHTIVSGHVYNTILEMIDAAQQKGVESLFITEHGPAMPGSCHPFYFSNLRVFPKDKFDIDVNFGAEANILDVSGRIDIEGPQELKCMDILIASLHPGVTYTPGTICENTKAVINAIERNPGISIIGHPDSDAVDIFYDEVLPIAIEHNVVFELNNSSNNPNGFRKGARERDLKYLELCKKYNHPITLGSDAHVAFDICNFNYIIPILKEVDFPDELILNTDIKKLKEFIRLSTNKLKSL